MPLVFYEEMLMKAQTRDVRLSLCTENSWFNLNLNLGSVAIHGHSFIDIVRIYADPIMVNERALIKG